MTPEELQAWLFPPVLTWRRKLAINAIMFCVLIATMYACGGQ